MQMEVAQIGPRVTVRRHDDTNTLALSPGQGLDARTRRDETNWRSKMRVLTSDEWVNDFDASPLDGARVVHR
jgi:hypothetical protein